MTGWQAVRMRFGFWTKNSQSYEDILECCAHAEATGWDGLWFADHFMPNEENVDQPIQEAWSILAALAAAVPRVRWARWWPGTPTGTRR